MKDSTMTTPTSQQAAARLCNRSACKRPGADWWNTSTRQWYCQACALEINRHNQSGICLNPSDVAALQNTRDNSERDSLQSQLDSSERVRAALRNSMEQIFEEAHTLVSPYDGSGPGSKILGIADDALSPDSGKRFVAVDHPVIETAAQMLGRAQMVICHHANYSASERTVVITELGQAELELNKLRLQSLTSHQPEQKSQEEGNQP